MFREIAVSVCITLVSTSVAAAKLQKNNGEQVKQEKRVPHISRRAVCGDEVTNESYSDEKELRRIWLIARNSESRIRQKTAGWNRQMLDEVLADSFDWFDCLRAINQSMTMSIFVPELTPDFPRASGSTISSQGIRYLKLGVTKEKILIDFVSTFLRFKEDFLVMEKLKSENLPTNNQDKLKDSETWSHYNRSKNEYERCRNKLIEIAGTKSVEQLEQSLLKRYACDEKAGES